MAAAAAKRKPKPKSKPKGKKRRASGNGRYEGAELAPRSSGKHPGGRPPKYHPGMARDAARLCANLGATDAQLADFFGVNVSTIWKWQTDHEEFSNALQTGKHPADERVKRSLYQRAVGYSFDSEKVFQFEGKAVRVPIREHVPPDPTSAIFFLKNRLPEEFRDRREYDTTVSSTPADEATHRRVLNTVLSLLEERAMRTMITVSPVTVKERK